MYITERWNLRSVIEGIAISRCPSNLMSALPERPFGLLGFMAQMLNRERGKVKVFEMIKICADRMIESQFPRLCR